jgi:3'(2'), 5'-bisphosphate nucleotidase
MSGSEQFVGLLPELIRVAEAAGRETMRFYGAPEAVWKEDGSPVTAADHAAEQIILPALRSLTPDIPVISEEEAAAGVSPDVTGPRFWLVDPLDGTKEFLKQNGEFTVNIALIEDGAPVLGVVHSPVTGDTYAAAGAGTATLTAGGEKRPISVRQPPAAGLTVVASRSHGGGPELDAFLEGLNVAELRSAGSSVKLCLVARGDADLYPRLGTTMEWDIAAGHAVLAGAGGRVETVDGKPFVYGKPEYRNPHFVAYGDWRR